DPVNMPWTMSYGANAQVFQRAPSLSRTFPDGVSNTLAIVEKYANCGGATVGWVEPLPDFRSTFADGGDVTQGANNGQDYPVTSGRPPVSINAFAANPLVGPRTFQVAPRRDECNFRWPSTPHRSGMLAALADGSVRTLHPAMSPTTFWGAVTPAGGEVLGADW